MQSPTITELPNGTTELRHAYHSTSARCRPAPDGTISRSVKLRLDRELCGMAGCACGASQLIAVDCNQTRYFVKDADK